MQTPMSTIEEFLSQRHLALVGVSRNPKDLSRVILRELRKRGYQVALVNPAGGMNGYWDLSRGPRERHACTTCHDPHAPAYVGMMPARGPVDPRHTGGH